MIQVYQVSDREGIRYILVGLSLLVVFVVLIGFSIYKNRLKEKKIDQEINKGVVAIIRGIDGDCSSLKEAKEIFLEAARLRIWLRKEITWIGFCEDMAEFCGKDHDQLEKRLTKIIELGENKVVEEAKFQLAMVQIWRKDFSASEQLLKDLIQGKEVNHRAEQYLRFLIKLKTGPRSEDI